MVECSFCGSSKSQRYVYTECNHFVCVNCAALRSGQTLMCCNKSTKLDESVKAFLADKKLSIMNNLQNQYEYEKTDVNKMSFDEIQRKLTLINQIEGEKHSKRLLNEPNKIKSNENTILEYDEKIYGNYEDKIFERSILQADTQTPIKLMSNLSVQIKNQNGSSSQIKRSLSSKKPTSNLKTQIVKLKQPSFSIKEFTPLLQAQLDFIKGEFQSIHEYLKKVQNDIIEQIKVYFQEYVNLIQKDCELGTITLQNIEVQKGRLKAYLQSTVQKTKLHQIKKSLRLNTNFDRIIEKNESYVNKERQSYDQNVYQKEFERSSQSSRPKNYDFNNEIGGILRIDTNEQYFENLRLNTMRDPSNNFENQILSPQPATTNRNLDKIYRKLEESRSKLEQRIQLHNQFMTKRCTKMSNI